MIKFLEKYRNTVLGSFFALILSLSMLTFGIDVFYNRQAKDEIVVNDDPIPQSEFQRARMQEERQINSLMGGAYDELAQTLLKQLNQRVSDTLINQRLLFQLAKELGLSAPSDEKIKEEIKKQFSQGWSLENYKRFLTSIGVTAEKYQRDFRKDLIIAQLRTILLDASIPTNKEIEEAILKDYNEYTVDLLKASPTKFTEGKFREVSVTDLQAHYESNKQLFQSPPRVRYTFSSLTPDLFPDLLRISEAEIQEYYNQNLELFRSTPQAKFQHIQLKSNPDAPAEEREKFEADVSLIMKQLDQGLTFERAVDLFSSDFSTRWNAGNSDWVEPGQLIPELDKEIWDRTYDRSTFIVRTDYGVHIARVTQYNPPKELPLDTVRDRIREELYQRAAPSFLKNKTQDMYEKWSDSGKTLEEFTKENTLPFFNSAKSLEAPEDPTPSLLGLTAKVLAEPDQKKLIVPLQSTYVLVDVQEFTPSNIPPFDSIKQKVVDSYVKSRSRELARKALEDKLSELQDNPNVDLRSISLGEELELNKDLDIIPAKSPAEPFRDPRNIEILFELKSGKSNISPIFSTPDGLYIAQVRAIKKPKPELIARKFSEYRSRAMEEQGQTLITALINTLRAHSNINVPPHLLQ